MSAMAHTVMWEDKEYGRALTAETNAACKTQMSKEALSAIDLLDQAWNPSADEGWVWL